MFATQFPKYTWHRSPPSRRSSMADANGHLSSCGLPPLLAWILLAGEQAQLEVAFNDVLIGHAAAPLAWRGHQRRQGDWRPAWASELWTSAPPPRLSLEALQAHYAASYQSRRPRKISTAAALSGEACPWYSPRGLRIWAKEAACSARGVHVCEDRHGTRCVCHTRPRSQKIRSRFFKIEPRERDFCAPTKRCAT